MPWGRKSLCPSLTVEEQDGGMALFDQVDLPRRCLLGLQDEWDLKWEVHPQLGPGVPVCEMGNWKRVLDFISVLRFNRSPAGVENCGFKGSLGYLDPTSTSSCALPKRSHRPSGLGLVTSW